MSASGFTRFQKKGQTRSTNKLLHIPGTKPSLYNNQLLVSTGVPSLDNVIGGGIAVGTLLMVEEDCYGHYSRLLLKYYSAESVMSGHVLLLSSLDSDPHQMLNSLPAPILDDPGIPVSAEGPSTQPDMKIAWRYQNVPQNQMERKVKFGHYYDLTKTMDSVLLGSAANVVISGKELNTTGKTRRVNKYISMLNAIKSEIIKGRFSTTDEVEKRNILRICIHSLGSPQWNEDGDDNIFSIPRFLLGLRSLLRSAFAVCIVTVPTHLFDNAVTVSRLEKLCDTVVHLDSFDGSDEEKNPVFSDYHGLLNIVQLPRLNSLTCHMPDTMDLAFKLRRKKFTIEKLHLPPELSETANRSQNDQHRSTKLGSSCGTARAVIDF